MFQDAIRAFKFMSDANYLPIVPTSCRHKVDSIVLNMSGFSAIESESLISILKKSDSKEFELRQLQELTLSSIMTTARDHLTRAVIIWALLERLIEYHSRNCHSGESQTSEYVEVNDIQSFNHDELIFDPIGLLGNAIPLEKLDLSTRTYNALKRMNIGNLIQLSSLSDSELRDIRNFGHKSISEVKELLARYALIMKSDDAQSLETALEESGDLYGWAISAVSEELEILSEDLSKYANLKVDYQASRNLSTNQNSQHIYSDCNTLADVHAKFQKQLASAKSDVSIEVLILNLDLFHQNFIEYKQNYLSSMPSKSQKSSLLKYENDYSDESIDLLKFDDFTCQLLGLAVDDSLVFLGKESYFEYLDSVDEYFVTDGKVWNLIGGITKFHEKYQTYPNTLGLIIAHHLGDQEEKRDIQKDLNFLFEKLRPNSAERDLKILQMRIDGVTLDEIGKQVSLTRERVRQILVKISPELISTIEVLRSGVSHKQEIILDNRFESIFSKYGAVYKSELAAELSLGEDEALKSTPKRFNKYIIDKFPQPITNLTWSREDCLNALRQAATYYFPMRQADYDHLVNIGEVKGPSVAYMYLKYGQWSELCVEAGVEFFPSVRSDYKRMWSEEELLSYARRFFVEPDTSGSYGGYDVWREQQTDHVPSGVLIRNVFGSWTTIKRKVLESLRVEKGLEVRNDI